MSNPFLEAVERINKEIEEIPEAYHVLIVKKDKWAVMHPVAYHALIVGLPVLFAWVLGRAHWPF